MYALIAVALLAAVLIPQDSDQPGEKPLLSTEFRSVDGVRIRVRTAGLDGRKAGQPVVVLESGASAPLETWDPILDTVAGFAPVVAYDRSGTGQSQWDELPPTPERIAARLKRVLAVLGVPPPYVLAGHSWGGALVRYFAGRHPEAVAGILYLDPTDITQTVADEIAVFESFGAGAKEHADFERMMAAAMATAAPVLRAESAAILDVLRRPLDERGLGPPPRVPTSVVIAGRPARLPPTLAFDTKAYAMAAYEQRVRRLRDWAGFGGTFEAPAEAGHMVHVDAPAVVVAAIRRLVDRQERAQ